MKFLRFFFPVLGLLLVPVILSMLRMTDTPERVPAEIAAHPIQGLWSKYPTAAGETPKQKSIEDLAAPLRFYYFHPDGIGLYRYGRVGLNNTHSYDYSLQDGMVEFRFRKTAEWAKSGYTIQSIQGREILTLQKDPREMGSVQYIKVRPPISVDTPSPLLATNSFGRMWTHLRQFQTGGMGFAIYQMHRPKNDGTGQGWFHEGDFDVWSTEHLQYHRQENTLELTFLLRQEKYRTPFYEGETKSGRVLDLGEDPRNYWHRQIYADGGESFAQQSIRGWVPFHWDLLVPENR